MPGQMPGPPPAPLATDWKNGSRRLLPVLLVAVAVLYVAWPLWQITPLTHDHPMHIFKSWLFWNQMLPSGRLRGWSHSLDFGFPYGELTPPGAEMWVAWFRVLTLGQLSWLATYSVAFAATLAVAAFAQFAFAARFFGRWAGAVAALCLVLDPGGWAEGGWFWCTDLGVWPVTLGLAFAMLALVFIDRLLVAPEARARNGLWAAVSVAASVLLHQLPVLVYAVALPFLLVDRASAGLPRRGVRRMAVALALGLALAGFYLVPMLTHSAVTLDLGVPWISHRELAKRLVDLTAFEHMWLFTASLALVGVFLALRRRRPGGFALAAAMLAFLLLSSSAFIDSLHAERLSLSLLKIESHRMVQVAKLFAFAFVGHAVASLALLSRQAHPVARRRSAAVVRMVLGLALLAAFAAPGFRRLYETQVKKELVAENQVPFWDNLQKFFRWMRVERKTSQGFYRVAYELPFYDHLSLIAPVFTDVPMYKVGTVPSQQFRSMPTSNEADLYRRLSVKWLLTVFTPPKDDFIYVRSFGDLHLYRFARYQEAPFTLSGAGTAELVHFEPERMVIRLRGTEPGSHLTVHVAGYDRWQATLDGVLLPIRPATALGAEYPFLMELPARDGELVLRYVPLGADWLGGGASLAALALVGLGLGVKRQRLARWLHPVDRWLDRRSVRWRKLALVASTGLAAVALARLARPRAQLPSSSLFTQAVQLSIADQPCESIAPLTWVCGGYHLRATTSTGIYGNHYCVRADGGPLRLTMSISMKSFAGDAVYGRYDGGYQEQSGAIEVRLGGQKVAVTKTRGLDQGLQFQMVDLRPYRTAEDQTLDIIADGSALHCLDFSTSLY